MSEYQKGFDAGVDWYKHHQGGRETMLIELLERSDAEIARLNAELAELKNPDEGRC
jgi:hypothetical protein